MKSTYETKTQTKALQTQTRAAVTLLLLILPLTGCISSSWVRAIPENKDFDGEMRSVWGTLTVRTRVNPQGTNPLRPLPSPPAPVPLTP